MNRPITNSRKRKIRAMERKLARLRWLRTQWSEMPAGDRPRMGNLVTSIKRFKRQLEQLATEAKADV